MRIALQQARELFFGQAHFLQQCQYLLLQIGGSYARLRQLQAFAYDLLHRHARR